MQPDTPRFTHVAVLGLGVMGGSLARALSELDDEPHITGWTPDERERSEAASIGAIHSSAGSWESAVARAELIVIATPMSASLELLRAIPSVALPEAVLTDVVSLKGPLHEVARDRGLAGRYVGSHPMVGGEGSGFLSSRADLYRDAPVWITADEASQGSGGARDRVIDFWEMLGARPTTTEASEHDRLMALCSHVPQLTANALARVLQDSGVRPHDLGPGGRDMTRLAASGSGMWTDLFEHSPAEAVQGLRALGRELDRLADALDGGDTDVIGARMDRTRAWRDGT